MNKLNNDFVLNNDWKLAHSWVDIANNDKEEFEEPIWKFDCNFKLDFDGAFMSVSSRFYYDREKDLWEGNVSLLLLGNKIRKTTLIGKNIDEIKEKAESLIKTWKDKLFKSLKNNNYKF